MARKDMNQLGHFIVSQAIGSIDPKKAIDVEELKRDVAKSKKFEIRPLNEIVPMELLKKKPKKVKKKS